MAYNPKAPRGKPNPPPAVKLKIGRPSTYRPEFDELVRRFALLGLTNTQIAQYFGVSTSRLQAWDKKHPSFKLARASGKETADADVANALRRRALGYTHKAEKIMLGPGGQVIREEYDEHYPPDTNAAMLWLANRHPDKWSLKPGEKPADGDGVTINIIGGLPDN